MQALNANKLKPAEYSRTVLLADVAAGVKPADLLEPGFWAHVANQAKRGDRIEAFDPAGEWFAELIVMESGGVWLKVKPLRMVELVEKAEEANASDPFYIEFAGRAKWRVVRRSDKAVIASGLESREAAQATLDEHLTATA